MTESRPLEGQTAIVTGASRGIGLAAARRLGQLGARVAITGRKADGLAAAVDELAGIDVLAFAGKADDPAHRTDVLDGVAAAWGRLDVLVANAGINPAYGKLIDANDALARRILDVNLLAPLAWVRDACAHPGLSFAEHGGRVVAISSVTGYTPSPGIGLYGISKAALMHLTRTLAVELAPRVRVNAVAPAVIRTRFAQALYEGREEEVAAVYPLGRLGEPDDVAGAVGFLVCADSSWITGQVLTVDGGLMAAGGTA